MKNNSNKQIKEEQNKFKKKKVEILQNHKSEDNQQFNKLSKVLTNSNPDNSDIKAKEKVEELDFKKQVEKLIIEKSYESIFLSTILIALFLYSRLENNIFRLFANYINSFSFSFSFSYITFYILTSIILIIMLYPFGLILNKILDKILDKIFGIIQLFKIKEVRNPKIISIILYTDFKILTERNIQIYIFKKAINDYLAKTENTKLVISIYDLRGKNNYTIYEVKDKYRAIGKDFSLEIISDLPDLETGKMIRNINLELNKLIDYDIDYLINKLYESTDGYIDIKKEDLYLK